MPREDKTGPMGAGSMTGRGLGSCEEVNGVNEVKDGADPGKGLGQGFGCRRSSGRGAGRGAGKGFGSGAGRGAGRGADRSSGRGAGGGSGRCFGGGDAVNPTSDKTEKEWLQEKKNFLQNRLEIINKQLENSSDS